MVQFPSMIEFIDEIGLGELHATHKQYMEDMEEEIPFDAFVKMHYEGLKESWEDDIQYGKKTIDVPFNEENEISLETAKMAMVAIVNKGLKEGVGKIVCDEDMVPDYFTVYPVIEEFYDKVMPAVEKALNELGV